MTLEEVFRELTVQVGTIALSRKTQMTQLLKVFKECSYIVISGPEGANWNGLDKESRCLFGLSEASIPARVFDTSTLSVHIWPCRAQDEIDTLREHPLMGHMLTYGTWLRGEWPHFKSINRVQARENLHARVRFKAATFERTEGRTGKQLQGLAGLAVNYDQRIFQLMQHMELLRQGKDVLPYSMLDDVPVDLDILSGYPRTQSCVGALEKDRQRYLLGA